MPIDLKEFEQAITEHFKNSTQEEILQNLRKVAPYLFEELTAEHQEEIVSILPEDTSIQQPPETQLSNNWLKENATAELMADAYNCLPKSEKEKFLATILDNPLQSFNGDFNDNPAVLRHHS